MVWAKAGGTVLRCAATWRICRVASQHLISSDASSASTNSRVRTGKLMRAKCRPRIGLRECLRGGSDMTANVLAASDQNLVWIELEMTGLYQETDRIIEIAVVVTDPQLSVRVEGPVFAVHQSDATLDAMDAWNKGTHGRSGLIDRVKASTITEADAVAQTIAFLKAYVPKGKSPMCRNSICQ